MTTNIACLHLATLALLATTAACSKGADATTTGAASTSTAAAATPTGTAKAAAVAAASTPATCPALSKKIVALFVAKGAGKDSLIKAGSEPELEKDCGKRDWMNKYADGVKCAQDTTDMAKITPDCDKKMMKMIMGM